jgi:Alginate export
MKNIFFLIIVSVLMTATNFAQSSFKVSGQIRPRLQMNNKDFKSDLDANNFTELRTRVGLDFSPAENITGFIQLQDSRVYGNELSTLASSDNLDLHQSYFTVNKLFNLPLNLKLGRMELSFGPQRIVGAVGWHNIGRSFDGGVIQLNTKKVDVDFFTAKTNESGEPGDTNDFSLIGAYGNLKLVKNYKIQPFLISELEKGTDFNRYTFGVYINGNMGNFSHEIEGAYQLGSMSEDVDITAFMFAVNAKYKFNTPIKPVVGIGIDYLSGDDGDDADKYKVFNTLYATNHKYYGYMDYFLNIPTNTYNLGLMDLHAKAEISPFSKFKAAIAFHVFNSNADAYFEDNSTSTSFGSEVDLTLIYTYNSAVKFQGGFSLFSPGEIFKETRGEDTSTWGYLMAVVNL